MPPLSTTPSAPTMTTSTFSKTHLWKNRSNELKTANEWRRLFNPKRCFSTRWLHPGLQLLEHWVPSELLPSVDWKKWQNNSQIQWMCVPAGQNKRTQFFSSVPSPGWVWLRLCHVDREAFLLRCSFFQHPEDNSGVRVGQDFLQREDFKKAAPIDIL